MAKSIVTKASLNAPGETKELHSDHHPHLFGKTLIWNLDKDNASKSKSTLGANLEMQAYAIAKKMNEGVIDNGMLQEMPHGEQRQFVAAIEKYLQPKQKLEVNYSKNGTHEFGNLTFSRKFASATLTAKEQKLQDDVGDLQKKYATLPTPDSAGQVLVSLVEGSDGKKHLLVNVHAESQKSSKAPRVNLNQLLNDVNKIKDSHPGLEIIVGGDMNAGKRMLPTSDFGLKSQNPKDIEADFKAKYKKLNYKHSDDNSAFLNNGTGIAVDAVMSTREGELKTLPDMNACDKAFTDEFKEAKKKKEEPVQSVQQVTPGVQFDLQTRLAASPTFNNTQIQSGNYQVKYGGNNIQNYPVELTFKDTRQARAFNNLVAVNDRKNLFQNENKVYLTSEAVTRILQVNINQNYETPHPDKLSKPQLTELAKACMTKAQAAATTIQTSNPPSIEYVTEAKSQDTRGIIDYSMKLTFANKKEARAFSDAMGYGNKTKLYQEGNSVYIAKDIEADFLKKTHKAENTKSYKARLEQITHNSDVAKKEEPQHTAQTKP
ncbi:MULTISPECIES: hypothetical protein [unclassified Legionella]|uniref:hypothetical protein n=1 Tax=unclassified Legionella TaxID=2622702 RepID=UPI0010546EE3|nr:MULTISPECIES: hypothetical protein [unclassified Legionella]MDI9819886.1 hypothetical protein [Legionella sp. PL877]